MKKIITQVLFIFLLPLSFLSAQSIIGEEVYFNSADYSLGQESIADLNKVIEKLDSYSEYKIKIKGHTDEDGSDSYNMELSQKRAEKVQEYFVDRGVNPTKISLAYVGESDLVVSDQLDESKKQSRRVTLQVEGYNYNNTHELVSQLDPNNLQIKTIDQDIESNITLSKGTEVKIPQGAFCHLDGSPLEDGIVNLEFKEAFDYADMVDESLFTQTADKWLETGGMIYIDATQNGQPVRLKEGRSIELLFPEQEQKDGMELFLGAQDEDGGIIWEETGEEITSVKAKKDMPMINVDLSPILDFEFKNLDTSALNTVIYDYPSPARIAYPPYKENYTEEGYIEACAKYETVMAAYELDKIERPAKLEAWKKEAVRRKELLFQHKKNYIRSQIIGKAKSAIVQLEKAQDKISHDRLVEVLFSFLNKDIGRVAYDEWYYVKKAFGPSTQHVRDEIGLSFPYYERMESAIMVRDFVFAIKEVENRITERKYELGYVDKAVMSRYIVSTSNLGWINCDRFYNYPDSEMMNLEFAKLENVDQYYLVFKNMKSLIRPGQHKNSIVFKRIPKGEPVRIVALNVTDGGANLAIQDLTLGSGQKINLNLASAEIVDLKKALQI